MAYGESSWSCPFPLILERLQKAGTSPATNGSTFPWTATGLRSRPVLVDLVDIISRSISCRRRASKFA